MRRFTGLALVLSLATAGAATGGELQYSRARKAWPRLQALVRRYHEAGLPPAAVLRMATHDAALGLRLEDIRNTRSIELVLQGGAVLRPPDLLAAPPLEGDTIPPQAQGGSKE